MNKDLQFILWESVSVSMPFLGKLLNIHDFSRKRRRLLVCMQHFALVQNVAIGVL
jgi:hypothetical protein